MLNRNELFLQIQSLSIKLFPDLSSQSDIAQKKLIEISDDFDFIKKAELSKSTFLIPSWTGNIADVFDIKNNLNDYSVLAVDGSQVYPDRNISGAGCFLINTGGCLINYSNKSDVKFFSEPTVFLIQDFLDEKHKISFSRDLVDLKREELELQKLFEIGLENNIDLCLVDGTIVFWPLEGKQEEVKNLFLNIYLNHLNKYYEKKILIAGYISFPKSKEIVNLIKLGLCRFDFAECIACHRNYKTFPCKAVDDLIDTQVLRSFLGPRQRSTVFYSKSKIVQEYPDHLKPCFFYLNIGKEIIRIETFDWVIKEPKNIDFICKVAIDQAEKGLGYPVVLAQAHEYAVVKGPDREFFYHLIQKIALEQQKRLFYSEKSLKKRGIAV
ncbi:MAG: DNA double-strand break repair nuclease NurA [bacterium]